MVKKPLTIEEIRDSQDYELFYIYKTPEKFLDIVYSNILDNLTMPLIIALIIFKIGLKT